MELAWTEYVLWALRSAFAIACGAACVAGCVWSRRVWPPLGTMLALGLMVRAWAALLLFAVSYLDLAILPSLHSGDGFWELAPDARSYYRLATMSAWGSPPVGTPSPSFVGALALWMRAAGTSPASPILLNLVLHVATCVLVIMAFRPLGGAAARRGALLTVAALSFSPVLILVSTQALKDVFFTFLVVSTTVSVFWLLSTFDRRPRQVTWALPMALVVLSVLLIGGVRPYYALFLWGAAVLALALRLFLLPVRAALAGAPKVVLSAVLLWFAFVAGAGEYYAYYGGLLARSMPFNMPFVTGGAAAGSAGVKESETAAASVDRLRAGFVRSGGATNLALGDDEARGGMSKVALGLAALFLPISLLGYLSVFEIAGGRGFLLVTDVDTVFASAAVIAGVWILATSRRVNGRTLPFIAFSAALGVVSAVLLAYVVMNYGTLFRLRLAATVPLWLLPLALAHWNGDDALPPQSEPRANSCTAGVPG